MMGEILVAKGATFANRKILRVPDFFSIFGKSFSENYLFYQIMDYAFAKSGYVIYSGEKIESLAGEGGPDFYIRDKSKVYLIEFKNVYLPANAKYSNDYTTVRTAIFNKFVQDARGHAEGVTQLANVIQKIKSGFLGVSFPEIRTV